MPEAAALAVDAGQGGVRAALVAGDRTLATAVGTGVARLGAAVSAADVAAQLVTAIRRLGPLPAERLPLAVGLSGFEAADRDELAALAGALAEALGVERTVLATDGLPALIGALGTADGVVVAAGTGTACLGRCGDRFAKVDGWGSLLGDAGSGFWIGRAGLDQALRRFDGRGGADGLMRAAERRFGPVDELADRVARDPRPARAVAGFAPDVLALAAGGDPQAGTIVAAAGRALAESACAAAARLYAVDEPVVVSYAGGILTRATAVRGAFVDAVAARRANTEVRPPRAGPLQGAALLAHIAPDLPADPCVLWRSR